MRILFAGTPDFAVSCFSGLIEQAYPVVAVLTQPDRPKGRGQKLTASPVKQKAIENNIAVYQPHSLKEADIQATITQLKPDLMIVVAYGLLLPPAVLSIPTLGCINVHASLLPRWRGAAPIQWAILSGDTETGVCIMQMEAGLDTGPVLYTLKTPIFPDDTTGILHDRLSQLGRTALLTTLSHFSNYQHQAKPQSTVGVTYATKIGKEDAQLNWLLPAMMLEKKIRAFNPFPGVYIDYQGERIKIWDARAMATDAVFTHPGVILKACDGVIEIATTQGILQLNKIQTAGGKIINVSDFLNANIGKIQVGDYFA